MTSMEIEEEKSLKQLIDELYDLENQFIISKQSASADKEKLANLKNQLLKVLEEKQRKSTEEIEKALFKKNNLIKRLAFLKTDEDKMVQDEIIKELEEYGRIRRYHKANLAKIKKILNTFRSQ